jgi:ADP-heptose:LPS heptosyltransferase
MNFLQGVVNFCKRLTRYMGPYSDEQLASRLNTMPIKILICRPNHRLGNLLLITPLLQEVSETFPNCKIDLFVKGHLPRILFEHYTSVNNIIQLPKRPFQHLLMYLYGWIQIRKNRYDIAINVDQSSSSGRFSVQFSNSRFKIQGNVIEDLKNKYQDYEHHAKFPVYNFRNYIRKMGVYQDHMAMPGLDLKLATSELAEGKKILKRLVENDNLTICFFAFATGKKCYTEQWWLTFYDRIRVEYPDINIIEVLPIHKDSKLSSRIPSFYSNDIRQLGSLIANTNLFIGADSGLMHLASSVQTPTVGLFSVTDQKRYAPYYNNSFAIDTNSSNVDECSRVVSLVLNAAVYEHRRGKHLVALNYQNA